MENITLYYREGRNAARELRKNCNDLIKTGHSSSQPDPCRRVK